MKYRPRWGLLLVGALVVASLFTFPAWHKLLGGKSAAPGAFALASDDQMSALAKLFKDRAKRELAYWAMLTPQPAPTDTAPTPDLTDASAILSGDFVALDGLRIAKGKVTIYRTNTGGADGLLFMRFEGFSITPAPTLKLYLCDNSTPTILKGDKADCNLVYPLKDALKGTSGDQLYQIPAETPLKNYKSVVIYSEDLDTIYTYASIQ
jgi:hypothetical protein